MENNTKKAQNGSDTLLFKGPDRIIKKRVNKDSLTWKGPEKKVPSQTVRPTKYKMGGKANRKK